MRERLQRTLGFVRSVRDRERLLAVAKAVARGGGVLALALVALVVVPHTGLAGPPARWGLGLALALGVVFAVGGPLWRAWRAAGRMELQAARIEALRPELGGRLHAALRYADAPQDAASPMLIELLARRVSEGMHGLRPADAHPMGPAAAQLAGASVAVVAALALLLGASPRWGYWFGEPAVDTVAVALASEQATIARVGDISLRYVYPPYTGLEDRVVPNSTGDVEAPVGTVVYLQVRTSSPVNTAALVVGELAPLEASLDEAHRLVSASFTVAPSPSTWRVELAEGEAIRPSASFKVTPVPDLAPVVTIEGEAEVEVAVDEPLNLAWQARDDYGVRGVELRVDGVVHRVPTGRKDGPEQLGRLADTPAELGLKPGASVQLVVSAWDNDTVTGSKRGDSRPVHLVVASTDGLDASALARQERLLALLVTALADFLEEPWPPGASEAQVARWGESVGRRLAPLDDLAAAYRSSRRRHGIEDEVLADVMEPLGALVRYTQVAFTPGVTALPAQGAWDTTNDLRDAAVVALEDGAFAIDRVLRMRAMKDVVKRTQALAEMGDALDALVQRPDSERLEVLAELDRLQSSLKELSQASTRLEHGGLRDFITARSGELDALAQSARQAMADGKRDEAQRVMGSLARGLRETAEWMQDELDAAKSRQDATADQVKELREELFAIEEAQRALQADVSAMRESQDAGQAQQVADAWSDLEQAAAALQRDGAAYRDGLVAADRAYYEQERAAQALEDGQRFLESVGARDLMGAEVGAGEAETGWTRSGYTLERELRRDPALKGPGSKQMQRVRVDLQRATDALTRLQRAANSGAGQSSPESDAMVAQQDALSQRLDRARATARKVAREMPVQPRGLEPALEQASERMEAAYRELSAGRALPAEGAQGVAAEQVRAAREALEQAQSSSEAQEDSGDADSEGEAQGKGDDQGDQSSKGGDNPEGRGSRLTDETEDFSAEAYRRALLEGMTGDVPEGYRALKKRYYEELVR